MRDFAKTAFWARSRSKNRSTSCYLIFGTMTGRTSKHGAFMGGADFVQWHGNYELLKKRVQLEAMAEELRARHGHR